MPAVSIESPIPEAWYPRLLEWMWEDPQANIDDNGAQTIDEIKDKFSNVTMKSWGIRANSEPCGAVAYQPLTATVGMFAGICFERRVHGTGVAREAVGKILDELWQAGVEKVSAAYFADNVRIARFLQKFGAQREGLLRRQTTRRGVHVDMELVAIFAPGE